MYSLDVAVWKGKRSEHEAALKRAKQRASPTLPRVVLDKKVKQVYGKTPHEMYESYLARVNKWMHDAPAQDWSKAYDKESYAKPYVPRERHKDKDVGGPSVKIGTYSPRGVYKGGGKCITQLVDPRAADADAATRDVYCPRIAHVEVARAKHKELHAPMHIPANKPLTCGRYFIRDIVCVNSDNQPISTGSTSNESAAAPSRKCAAQCASPERSSSSSDEATERFAQHIHSRVGHDDPPPTAEAVASPQWRPHSPHKWCGSHDFGATIPSSHAAALTSISGMPYAATVRLGDRFVPRSRGELTPTDPAVRAREHKQRAQTAAMALQSQRSPQRTPKTYFRSMWTEGMTTSPGATTRLGGRDLVLALRDQARVTSSSGSGS